MVVRAIFVKITVKMFQVTRIEMTSLPCHFCDNFFLRYRKLVYTPSEYAGIIPTDDA